jgi:hypothetical protein
MTPKQLSSVPCPRCGVATGKQCVLRSGALRPGPHVDRRLAAIESLEIRRDHVAANLSTRKSQRISLRSLASNEISD